MTKQVKVFFAFLAFAAVISVFSFFDVFRGVRSSILDENGEPLEVDYVGDFDKDGLPDIDESYWNTDFQNPDTDGDGFLDGEEVASGNDPREPSDHPLSDSLEDTIYGTVKPVEIEDMNFTDTATGLLAGAIVEGDVARSDPEKQTSSLGNLSLSLLDDFYKFQTKVQPGKPATVVDNSTANQVEYLEAMAEIVKNDLLSFPLKLDTSKPLTGQAAYMAEKGKKFETALAKAQSLEVPSAWTDIHSKILSVLARLTANYISMANYEADIIKSILALNEMPNLDAELRALLTEIELKISSEKLPVEDELFRVLEILRK